MANEEQLAILRQGVKVWNKWRQENFTIAIDLMLANLRNSHLCGVQLNLADLRGTNLNEAYLNYSNFQGAYLWKTDLQGANLSGANLAHADLSRANLQGANLEGANFSDANLLKANFTEANLTKANFTGASLVLANLNEANLNEAILCAANVSSANLEKADFLETQLGMTIFGNNDLSSVKNLGKAMHIFSSSIGTGTFSFSRGEISQVFLRGCGLPDWEIEGVKLHNPELSNDAVNKILYKMYELRATQALQISPLFISYNQSDATFVDKLENQLSSKGIRFWRDIHDMKSGRIEKQIDRAIRQNPTVLLILSEHSLESDWVEHEVRTARTFEKGMGRDVLCPVALDDSWKSSRWPKRIMEQIMEYNILDFSAWQDDSKFEGMFRKLIDGLELFYKG